MTQGLQMNSILPMFSCNRCQTKDRNLVMPIPSPASRSRPMQMLYKMNFPWRFSAILVVAGFGGLGGASWQTAWPARPCSPPLIDEQKDEKLTMKKCVMAGALLTCNISSYHLETAGRAATSRLLPRLHPAKPERCVSSSKDY